MYAVKTLVLCIGLAQLWLAMPYLADRSPEILPAVRGIGEDTTTEAGPHCDNPRIEVAGIRTWVRWTLYTSGRGLYHFSDLYGHSLEVSCYGSNPARLTMVQDGTKLQARQGKNKIDWFMGKVGLIKTKFACIDTQTNCEEWVYVTVKPAMNVLADKYSSSSNQYIIEYGNPLEVWCSGPPDARLTMTKAGEELETANVYVEEDGVKIRWFERKPDLQVSEYRCTDADTGISNNVTVRVKPYFRRKSTYRLVYGKSNFEVFCSGSRTVKLFTVEGGRLHKELLTEKVNDTSVKSFIVNLKLGESTIACVDGEVPDYMSTMSVVVTPRLDVSSPEISLVKEEYYIKHGDPLEIICSGPDATRLTISKKSHLAKEAKELNYTVVNETALKWYIKNNTPLDDLFLCYEEKAYPVYATVHTLPMASSFRCVSENVQYLTCSWAFSLKYSIDYSLYYMENGNSVHICTKSGPLDKEFCVWNYRRDIKVFTFLMQSCNELVGCSNQTFLMDHVSIIKSDPPYDLEVKHTSRPNAVELYWAAIYFLCAGELLKPYHGHFQFKVQYEYPGAGPVEVNSSLVSCDIFMCNIKLELPCPGQFYTIWVYQKLKKAVGEEYWSRPGSTTFHSDLVHDGTVIETCNSQLGESKEVVLHSVYNLNNDVVRKMQELRKRVGSLQEKRARIQGYLAQRRQTDEL